MQLKSLILFAVLSVILYSQLTPNKAPYNVLMNCLNYMCPTDTKACLNAANCTSTISTCEPQTRYADSWSSSWTNCTASNAAALALFKCKSAFRCALSYQQAYGATNLKGYLNDTNMQFYFKEMTRLPKVWQNSTTYVLDMTCVASTCTNQIIYCLLNGQCQFLYALCWPSSATDQEFAQCVYDMGSYNYYLASLLSCWENNCMV